MLSLSSNLLSPTTWRQTKSKVNLVYNPVSLCYAQLIKKTLCSPLYGNLIPLYMHPTSSSSIKLKIVDQFSTSSLDLFVN